MQKLYFHWLTRGQASLQWFAEEVIDSSLNTLKYHAQQTLLRERCPSSQVTSLAALDPAARIEVTMHLTDQSGASPFQRRLLRMAELAAAKRGQDAVSGIQHGRLRRGSSVIIPPHSHLYRESL